MQRQQVNVPTPQNEHIDNEPADNMQVTNEQVVEEPQEVALRRSVRQKRPAISNDYVVYSIEHEYDLSIDEDPVSFRQAMEMLAKIDPAWGRKYKPQERLENNVFSFNSPSTATSSTATDSLNHTLFVTVDFFTTIALHSAEETFLDSSPPLFLLDGEEHPRVTKLPLGVVGALWLEGRRGSKGEGLGKQWSGLQG
ncbi:hypothetical protein SESBI_07252 [Sesbania bispinosa]|nr:hypothetical protein SESBI_07252 [Sesbania bispinosa]